MAPTPRSSLAGLTLLELLFAVTILAFVLLGVAGMFPSAFRTVVRGGQTSKAIVLAQGMMDVIRSEPFDVLISKYNAFTTTAALANYSCPVTAPSSDPNYTKMRWKCDLSMTTAQSSGQGLPSGSGSVSVACVNADGTANATTPCPTDLRRVTVTVRWDQQNSRSVSVVTNVARTD